VGEHFYVKSILIFYVILKDVYGPKRKTLVLIVRTFPKITTLASPIAVRGREEYKACLLYM
jgi:hypothetical protein